VALARGVNASLLRRWVAAAEGSRAPIAIQRTAPATAMESPDSFVPVSMPALPTEGTIRIKIRRRGSIVGIEWPASAARECALLLKELMR